MSQRNELILNLISGERGWGGGGVGRKGGDLKHRPPNNLNYERRNITQKSRKDELQWRIFRGFFTISMSHKLKHTDH